MSQVFVPGNWIPINKEKIRVGLGWAYDPVNKVDLDLSLIAFDKNNECLSMIYYKNLSGFNGALKHLGDNKTGEGEGDNEIIIVDLTKIPEKCLSIAVLINSFTEGSILKAREGFIRLFRDSDQKEVGKFTLGKTLDCTGLLLGLFVRSADSLDEWFFRVMIDPLEGKTAEASLASIKKLITVYKEENPLPNELGMTPDEEALFNELNAFRVNPSSLKEDISTLKRGIKQLNPKDPMIPEYRNLKKELGIYEPVPAFQYSRELSAAAHGYLEKCKKRPPTKKILLNEECNGIVPSNFMQGDSYTMVYFDDEYDEPKPALISMLAGKDDPEKFGKAYLTSDNIKQIGIAVDKEHGHSHVVLFLDDDPVEPNNWQADFDDSELKLAFECLDFEGKNRLNIAKVLEFAEEQGYNERNPTLTNMLAELNNRGKEFISYKEFAEHFNGRLQHEEGNEQRDQEIFNVYLPDEQNIKSIDNAQLKQIRDYTNSDFDDEKIDNMLRMNQHNKFGIDFEEYKDILAKKGQ